MSEPSDTSSEDYTNDEYPGYASTATTTTTAAESNEATASSSETMVSNILDLIPSGTNNNNMSDETRAAINEVLYKLEALQTSSSSSDGTATSSLLNGVWELKYYGGYIMSTSGNSDNMLTNLLSTAIQYSPTRLLSLLLYTGGGYSPGIFLYQLASQLSNPQLVSLGDVEVSISRIQPRIEATIPIQLFGGSSSSTIQLIASLDVVSNLRLRETYDSINFFKTTNLQLPDVLKYKRDIYVTYVDNDLLIVRDSNGIPEVLVRQNKSFRPSTNIINDPIDIDDITPPGVDYSSDVIDIGDDDDSTNAPSY